MYWTDHPTRRQLLGGVAGLMAAPSWAADGDWYDKPMRWAQLAFVEKDAERFDLPFWLDYFKKIHADAACLSAGGCVAFYPTKVALHYKSQWLADRDLFGELVAGCRKLSMVVVGRVDPHAIHQNAYDAHPEWVMVTENGEKRRHWAQPELWVTCAYGPYNFDFMTGVITEIMERYRLDGIFANRWSGHGTCYCEHCKENFRKASGMELPRSNSPQDPQRKAYILWKEQRLFELWRKWDATIRKINPHASFLANSGGGALSSLDMKTIGEMAPTLFADRQARRGLAPPWENGKNGKEYRSTLGAKAIAGIFSVGVEEPYRWKDSVQSDAEIKMWVADGAANGLRAWFTKFGAYLYDPRWLKTVEDIYAWQYRNERYLRNTEPLARVAMVYSQQTGTFYGRKVADHIDGYYHALIEARIPFEMAHDRLLDAEHVDRYRVLVLPNLAALTDDQCRQIEQYVERGGGVVATYETSRYDQWGVRRPDFGLARLFGVRDTGRTEGPMQNSYLRLESKTHPLLAGLEDVPRIINGVRRIPVEPVAQFADPLLTLVPSYPDLPMEEVYPRTEKTNIAEVYVRDYGRGRVVYFPWDIDRTFWEVLCVEHGKLLANAVDWAANEERPVTVHGPGIVDVTYWRQKESLTVHLVNLSNPMMMKGPLREILPIGEQKVRARLPQGVKVRRVHLLTSGLTPKVEQSGRWVTVIVPKVDLHEVVAIDVA